MWLVGTFLSQFSMAIIAGNIIACERADRSAQFLAYQGESRKMLIASKLLICIFAFILICLIAFLINLWLPTSYRELPGTAKGWQYQVCAALVGLCCFGSAWFFSSIQSDPARAILIGILSPWFFGWFLTATSEYFFCPQRSTVTYWWLGVCGTVGLLSLVGGTRHFLRSKES